MSRTYKSTVASGRIDALRAGLNIYVKVSGIYNLVDEYNDAQGKANIPAGKDGWNPPTVTQVIKFACTGSAMRELVHATAEAVLRRSKGMNVDSEFQALKECLVDMTAESYLKHLDKRDRSAFVFSHISIE